MSEAATEINSNYERYDPKQRRVLVLCSLQTIFHDMFHLVSLVVTAHNRTSLILSPSPAASLFVHCFSSVPCAITEAIRNVTSNSTLNAKWLNYPALFWRLMIGAGRQCANHHRQPRLRMIRSQRSAITKALQLTQARRFQCRTTPLRRCLH